MAENSFRILLDFRELNFKFYKFVWMSVSPRELVTIKDLKAALLKKFSFERTDLLLFLRDGLLPEDENISNILRENDNVRLFYAEPPNVNLYDSRTINYEGDEESPNDHQVKSTKKRKEHSDIPEDNNEQIEFNKKRKHSFSNGTYLFKDNGTPENSALISVVYDDIEKDKNTDLYNFENNKSHKSCKFKKKLKYSHDIYQDSLVSEKKITLSSDIPISEKSQNKINSCKKKKKHKHSKDISENEIIFQDKIVKMSEKNENESRLHKKKKYKHPPDTSEMASVSKSAVSFCNESIDSAEKLNDTLNVSETRNELSELRKSISGTVTDDSEILKLAPVSFCASSVSTSSGIGHSLKTSQESNQKISPEKNCSKSYIFDSKPIPEIDENNQSVSQGNSCEKRKRKRCRKRKSMLISPQVDVSNDCNLDMKPPEKNENLDSLFTSTSYQTAIVSPGIKETSDNSKFDALYSKKYADCSQTKSSFVESFGNYLSSTSTPFSQTHAVSPRKNVIFKMLNSSNAFEDQSCSVTPLNTTLPDVQKKLNENYQSARPSLSSVTKNKNNATVPNHNFREKSLSTKMNNFDKSNDSTGSYLSTHFSPCNVTKDKNTIVPNHNFHKKDLSSEINNSDKSIDSLSNIGIKSQFLDPSFSYKGYPPLNSCPLVGTRIAYKILELDASYSPVVSNYKEGIVKAVNSQTDELEIELIEPEVKEGRIGKFENLYEDELPSCEVIRKVTLSWPSLIDPVRVIY